MLKNYIPILLLLVSCGKSSSRKPTTNNLELINNKSNLYSKLVSHHQDKHGFILTEECDALIFSGLLSAARPDLKIDIRSAQDSSGNWYRRPNKDCGPSFGNSRSTVSRDMMLGLYWHIWKHKDLELATNLMNTLKSNLYYMVGEGTAGELLMNPSFMNTLAEMIVKLGGPRYEVELVFPAVFGKGTGFIAHLTAWHIALRGQILGKIPSRDLDILKFHVDRSPNNPLFQAVYHRYTDGDQSTAISQLLNSPVWPNGRLPKSEDRCDEWPIQRDFTPNNWEPCSRGIEHTGADLITVYELIIKD